MFRCLIYGARMHMRRSKLTCALACLMLGMLFSMGCGRRTTARLPAPARIGSSETGIASWYGVPYHGRRSASGEIYDMEKLTAAHRALPFQTWVEVTNLSNGKQVNVRITDRGPFVHGRIIDVSMAAARQLDMVRSGTARVKLKVIAAPVNEPPANALPVNAPPVNALVSPQVNSQTATAEYAVQAGAFSDPVRAEPFRQSLPYSDSRVLPRQEGSSLWRVVVGHALTLPTATTLAAEVAKTAGQAVVVKEDPARSTQ